MAEGMVNLEINDDLVKPILEKKISAAITASLGDPELVIGKLVELALKQKVNEEGEIGSDKYYNKYDFIEALTGKAIRKATQAALEEWLTTNTEKVKAAVMKELKKPTRQRSIATAFADTVEKSLKCSWLMKCNIDFQRDEDE
jgi:hypothetical protein